MEKQPPSTNLVSLLGGFITFIGFTLFAMTNNWFGFDKENYWPIYVVLVGIFTSLAIHKDQSSATRSTLAFLGTTTALLGLFFLPFTFGMLPWRAMDESWPAYLLMPGLGLIAAYFSGGRKTPALAFSGVVLAGVSAVIFFFIAINAASSALEKTWPLFIIVAGVSIWIIARMTRK